MNLSISNFGAHDRLSTPNLSERKVTVTKVKSKLQFKLQSKLLDILAKQNNRIEKLEKLRSSHKSSKIYADFTDDPLQRSPTFARNRTPPVYIES